jgi:hypothetical protein
VVLCQVLTGMGGVGKTQLAVDLAEEAWGDGRGVDLLVWVTAGSRDAIVAEYARAGAQVCGAQESAPQQAARAFLAWLRGSGRRWLVVLDDVADPADVSGLWPPAVAYGRTVVTTRRRDAALSGGGRHVVEVGVFTAQEAQAYVASVLTTAGRTEPPGELAGLAADLGCLPLALSQAAAYILDAGIPVSAYRQLLVRQARSLADISPDVPPDDQTHTMAAAWELSVDYADRLRPRGLARPMLELAAFLAPNGTPTSVLTSPAALHHLARHRSPDEPVTPQDAEAALRALHRLSLLTAPGPAAARDTADWDGRTVHVHQVVQRATRDTLATGRYGATARTAADALLDVWPRIERDTGLAQALRACATALMTATDEGTDHAGCLYEPEAHGLLNWLGHSLGESGQVTAAARHYLRLTRTTTHYLGPDHPHTLITRGNLAYWRYQAGDAAGAAAVYAELLPDQVRVLGSDHPDTFIVRNNLASWQGEVGDAAGAAAAFAQLLDDCLRVLGPDHPDTLATRSSLAGWRGEAGDAAGAEAALAELLDDCLRVLGPDHPNTLATRGNLARWRGQAGDAAGAEAAFAELLPDQVRVLGPDHPGTLTVRSHLAYWRGRAGDAAGAATAFARLLDDCLLVLGPDHPDTLNTRNHLAHWQGQAAEADP